MRIGHFLIDHRIAEMSSIGDDETCLVFDKTETEFLVDDYIKYQRIEVVKMDLDERFQGILHLLGLLKKQLRNQAFLFEKLGGFARLLCQFSLVYTKIAISLAGVS